MLHLENNVSPCGKVHERQCFTVFQPKTNSHFEMEKVLLQAFQLHLFFYINFPLKSSRIFQRKSRGSFKKMRLQNIEHFDKHFKLHSVFDAKKAVDFIRPLKFGSPSRV